MNLALTEKRKVSPFAFIAILIALASFGFLAPPLWFVGLGIGLFGIGLVFDRV